MTSGMKVQSITVQVLKSSIFRRFILNNYHPWDKRKTVYIIKYLFEQIWSRFSLCGRLTNVVQWYSQETKCFQGLKMLSHLFDWTRCYQVLNKSLICKDRDFFLFLTWKLLQVKIIHKAITDISTNHYEDHFKHFLFFPFTYLDTFKSEKEMLYFLLIKSCFCFQS